MRNRITFGRWETVALLVNLICTNIFLSFTRMMAEDAGSAGWIMTIFVSLAAFFIYFLLMRLFKKFDGKDILEIAEIAGGKLLKIIAGLVISATLFYSTVVFIREFSEDMKVISLPASPLSYVMAFFIIGMAAGCFLGMEAIVRLNAILIPVIAAGYILILIGAIPDMKITNLFPILGTGAKDIIVKGVLRISVFAEILLLFLLPPFLGGYKNVSSSGYIALSFSSVFLTAGSLVYILTFAYPGNLELFLPIYHMARLINLGRFFQRIESLFVLIWAMSALLYLTSLLYFSIYTAAKTAGLKYLDPLILPFAVTVFSAAFIPPNMVVVIKAETNFIYKSEGIALFGFFAVILALANLRKRPKEGGH